MEPVDNVGPHKKEDEIYSDQLHQVVKSDAELKLQNILQDNEEKCQRLNERCAMTLPIQQKRQLRVQNEKRLKNIEKLRQKHNDIRTFNQATIVRLPNAPPYNSQLHRKRRQQQQQRREQEIQTVQAEIAQFETRKKRIPCSLASLSSGKLPSRHFPVGGIGHGFEVPGSGANLTLQSNSKYIQDIRHRLKEKTVAREQKEKRQDRFLVEQLKAQEAQEEAEREEQLVKRLTRQTQQEQRLATQLLQIRAQKDGIYKNRLLREQQYQMRRKRDFQEALEREAALAQQAKLDRAEEIREELESCNRIAAERAQARFMKHSQTCKDILEQIVDLATKFGEYRLHTGNLIPEKQMREWKKQLFSGLPLYEPVKCQEILQNQDCEEYTNMVDEWAWPEEAGETKLPLTNNNIFGHVIQRLRNIVHPPIIEPSLPSLPHFTIKACVLGKFCSGKTSCLTKLAEAHGIYVLSVDSVIEEARNAYHNAEEVTEKQGEEDTEQLLESSASLKPDLDTQEESRDSNLTTRAMQGTAAEKVLREGNAIPDELLVDIMVEAIRKVPAQSSWILDGFPLDITQAHLLEKAMGGSVDEGDGDVSSSTELAANPNTPEPSPPPPPALDLALLLDIPDECAIGRSFSHTETHNADARTSCPIDNNLYLEQIQHRITAFQDAWPKLEKWFGGRQNILVRVDADVDEEELHKRVESVLQQVMMQTQEAPTAPPDDDVVLDSGNIPDSPCSASPTDADQAQGLTNEAHKEFDISFDEESDQRLKSLSKSSTNFPQGSISSVTNEDFEGVPPKSASPCPGLSSWVYVDEPLPPELPECLCSHWDMVYDSYVNNLKMALHQMHSQQSVIQLHLFNIGEEYKHCMERPDFKEELVSHWQKDFNSIPDDNREDEDSKAELHLKLDELCERLWDISDKQKEEDKKEGAKLDSWLEEHIAVLVNHHSVLMQVELEHLQDRFRILKVYYLAMYGDVVPELPSRLDSIPVLHLTDIKHQDGSTEPAGRSVSRQMDDEEDKTKTELCPNSQTENRIQAESVELPHEKLISDYEEALAAIRKLVSAEVLQVETNEQEEKADNQEVRDQIHKEYAAALDQEGNVSKARIALVKGHGLVMVKSLQSGAAQTLTITEKWLEAHYLAEMKSIERLSQVVGHLIETGAKLQYELMLYVSSMLYFIPPILKCPMETSTQYQIENIHEVLVANQDEIPEG